MIVVVVAAVVVVVAKPIGPHKTLIVVKRNDIHTDSVSKPSILGHNQLSSIFTDRTYPSLIIPEEESCTLMGFFLLYEVMPFLEVF